MMCGSAAGVLLPPYVIYRAEKMWTTWTQNGPKGAPCCADRCCKGGARYSRTSHGWIEATTFIDWFVTCFLPHARNLPGQKVIIRDNLAAHFTDEVLDACKEHYILFTCLPANASHLTQPLDVSFFRPMKMAWRDILLAWKMHNLKTTTIPKEEFPRLLQSALEKMDKKCDNNEEIGGAIKKNLISGFAATGICPIDPDRVLKRLPGFEKEDVDDSVNTSLIDFLKNERFGADFKTSKTRCKRTNMNVVPRKRVTRCTSDNETDIDSEEENEIHDIIEQDDDVFEDRNDEDINFDTINVGHYVQVR